MCIFKSSSPNLLLLSLFTLLIFANEASPVYISHFCTEGSYYRPNTTFQTNLNVLLSSLVSKATLHDGFYLTNISLGTSNQVKGLFLCRGDVAPSVCHHCVTAAAKNITHHCTNQTESIIWYNQCMLRYSNNFLLNNIVPEVTLENVQIQSVPDLDLASFDYILSATLNDVQQEAVNSRSGKKFATKAVNLRSFMKLYTLVQCASDLSTFDCNMCLSSAFSVLSVGRRGARSLLPACNLRYELYPFYNVSAISTQPELPPPSSGNKWNKKRKLVIIGVAGAAIAGVLICIAFLCLKYKSSTWQHFWLTSKSNQNIEAFLKNHGALTLKRYKLSYLKKMTNNFKAKLGQGGFGAVYKGKLSNGSPVAVKMLNASKKNGEEFINEVASISRTSHINVVTLLGFCLEGRKRALIYEFMPNGSLDKFIYRKGPETITPLSWDILNQIAMGIAQGLEYLHRGCNTRILHFDIKPHNILLDENFCPKISDFGLAKLCPRNESIISMSDARGTTGYVAPEMWTRHLGGISHKSDVYSYGMMLLEMVGGRKNINAEASHTSEIYFPHWAYNKLELDTDLRPDRVMTTEENEIAKRLAVVGLWCIQTFPNDRPTMSRVIDMLEGNMNSLEIPPKPLFSSPTTSAPESSIP